MDKITIKGGYTIEGIRGIFKDKAINVTSTNDVSDGFHTFGELYDHRITLFIALCRKMKPYHWVWRSKEHHTEDQKMYEGWFILGMGNGMSPGDSCNAQISYHLPLSRWEETDFLIDLPNSEGHVMEWNTLSHAPKWDGHTPQDVLSRLKNL